MGGKGGEMDREEIGAMCKSLPDVDDIKSTPDMNRIVLVIFYENGQSMEVRVWDHILGCQLYEHVKSHMKRLGMPFLTPVERIELRPLRRDEGEFVQPDKTLAEQGLCDGNELSFRISYRVPFIRSRFRNIGAKNVDAEQEVNKEMRIKYPKTTCECSDTHMTITWSFAFNMINMLNDLRSTCKTHNVPIEIAKETGHVWVPGRFNPSGPVHEWRPDEAATKKATKRGREEMLPLFIRNKAAEIVLSTEVPASTKGSLLYAFVEKQMTRLNEICMAQGEHMELRQMSMCSPMGGELVDPNKGLFEQGFRGLESIAVHIVRSSESGK